MSDAPVRSFTSRKLDWLLAACCDPRISDGQFRMMYRVSAAANAQTGVALISDPTIMDDVPNCQTPSTCRKNRRAIEAVGYWNTRPGHGRKGEANSPTEYELLSKPVAGVVSSTEEKKRQRQERKRRDRLAWKARKREEAARITPPGEPEPQRERSVNDTPRPGGEAVRTGEGEAIWRGGVIRPDRDSPSYTPSTETPSLEATDESVEECTREADPPGVVIPKSVLSRLGLGDIEEGRRIADAVPPALLTRLLDRASKFGASSVSAETDHARLQALGVLGRKAAS